MLKQMPWVGIAFIIAGLAGMGMPGFSGFIAEYPIFMGLFEATHTSLNFGSLQVTNYYPIIALFAVLGIVITAAYVLRVISQVFFGEFRQDKYPEVADIFVTDRIILLLLGVPLLIIGLYPAVIAPMVEAGVRPVVALLGGGF